MTPAQLAHKLRTPLAVMRMAAYNIRHKCPAPEIATHIDSIEAKVAEMQKIIENFLSSPFTLSGVEGRRRPPVSKK